MDGRFCTASGSVRESVGLDGRGVEGAGSLGEVVSPKLWTGGVRMKGGF